MQNKPNFQKHKMNINQVLTRDYTNTPLRNNHQNKPNSNPIAPNPRKAKKPSNSFIHSDLPQKTAQNSPEKRTQLQKFPEMNITSYLTNTYENLSISPPRKRTQAKPNFQKAGLMLCQKKRVVLIWI